MTDREKIMSPDYTEILSDFTLIKGLGHSIQDYVSQPIDTNLVLTYINEKELEPITEFTYRSIPKIYGLMQDEPGEKVVFDSTPLMQSGILQVQGAPLNLTGRGVVIGFLDTGERVIILSS